MFFSKIELMGSEYLEKIYIVVEKIYRENTSWLFLIYWSCQFVINTMWNFMLGYHFVSVKTKFFPSGMVISLSLSVPLLLLWVHLETLSPSSFLPHIQKICISNRYSSRIWFAALRNLLYLVQLTLALGIPAQASFLRVQPPRPAQHGLWFRLGAARSGWWWSFRGKKQWDTNPWVFPQAHSTQIHSLAIQSPPRILQPREREVGLKKDCHAVHISWNYNLTTSADSHLRLTSPGGLLMTTACRKHPGAGISNTNAKHSQRSRSHLQQVNCPRTL